MPNIKQQKKRVRTASEERIENLRYRSTIKTLTKRLATAAEGGDAATIEQEHKALVQLIDRAVARALRRTQDAGDVARAPRVRQVPRRRLGAGCDEQVDLDVRHRVAVRPRRELVDLARELVQVVADELRQPAARIGVGLDAVQLELLADPAVDRLVLDIPDHDVAPSRDSLR